MSVEAVGRWGVEALRAGRFFALMPDDEERAGFLTRRHEEILAGVRYPGH